MNKLKISGLILLGVVVLLKAWFFISWRQEYQATRAHSCYYYDKGVADGEPMGLLNHWLCYSFTSKTSKKTAAR